MNSCIRVVLLLALILGVSNVSEAGSQFWKKKKKKVEVVEKKAPEKKKDSYDKLLKDAVTQEGLFKLHVVKKKYYFEIPKALFGRDFILASRVTSLSNNEDVGAGQMPRNPMLLTIDADDENLFLIKRNTSKICDESSEIYDAFKRNNVDPIWKSFKIKAFSNDSSSVVIDVTAFFGSQVAEISPFRETTISDIMTKGKGSLSGTFIRDGSKILGGKVFPNNIVMKSQMCYNTAAGEFTSTLTRSIVLLKEKPMRPRIADDRIGYFAEYKIEYTEKKDEMLRVKYINRWDLKPRKEDIAKYKRGELVVPEKPIVWYVDTAIPEKWRKYIRMGIEDWKVAFEEIGFKDAIIAKDYPKNDPDFDPDDIRYSCYKYITTTQENSMGPSWVDPRSGEIICGDVLFYSNVVKLLHSWQFIQTGAVDPRVRKEVFPDDVMGSSLRYVAAHEVGHTLGLMHNFGASHAIPVDSLRSAKFTQKYGTTASIMDYARYNYVAQPGDKGVRLTPPDMGVYDKFAIKWGYKPIFDANTAEEESATLNNWILEKKDDPMYHYGPQLPWSNVDPDNQSEDIGDDLIKSSTYGIKNLKTIIKNLNKWTTEEGKDYNRLKRYYIEVRKQLGRYLQHSMKYIGGVYTDIPVKGDNKVAHRFVSKKKQKEALKFVYKTIMNTPNWLMEETVIPYLDYIPALVVTQTKVLGVLCGGAISSSLINFEKTNPKEAYRYSEYIKDLHKLVWAKSTRGARLSYYDRIMEDTYVNNMLIMGKFKAAPARGGRRRLTNELQSEEKNLDDSEISIFKLSAVKETPNIVMPIAFSELESLRRLLKKRVNTASIDDRNHYKVLLHKINKAMKE